MAHAGGRPLKFKSVEEFCKLADKYFKETPENEITITGLALALDTTRDVLINYQERDEYSNAIKRYKERVHNAYEKDLRLKGNAGSIFALKNFGWSDRIDLNGQMNHTLSVDGIMQTLNQSGLPTLDGDDLSTNTDIEDGETITPDVT